MLSTDQAVNSLCDIWHPDDIPVDFRTSSRTAFSASLPCDTDFQRDALTAPPHDRRNTQLPSPPISPSSQPSPSSPPPPVQSTPSLISYDEQPASESSRGNQLLPIKGFVHEVLRRSRTSTGVLQTALCYLEAIRSKVPEILQKEKSKAEGADQTPEADAESRIIIGEDFEEGIMSMSDADSDSHLNTTIQMAVSGLSQDDVVPTVRIEETDDAPLTAPPTQVFNSMSPCSAPHATLSNPKAPSATLPPMPPLPSPLLCPRRTFLACLILASKFMQDRSYSNRAWAKLAGLPPREIGRCERALGEALEWRLWVGKCPSPNNSTGSAPRPVTRCRSENNLAFGVSSAPTLPLSHVGLPVAANYTSGSKLSGLRRSATVPSLGTNYGPVQEPFVQHSLFLSSKPFEEPESFLPDSIQVDSPASMFVSPPPTMFVTPPPPAPTSAAPMLHPQSFASISQFFDEFSPSLSTPGLSYSPMSTASTSSSEDGERTIQMSTFMDLPTPLPGPGLAAMAPSGSCAYAASATFDLAANPAMNTKPGAGMNRNSEVAHQMNQNWTGGAVDGLAIPNWQGSTNFYSHSHPHTSNAMDCNNLDAQCNGPMAPVKSAGDVTRVNTISSLNVNVNTKASTLPNGHGLFSATTTGIPVSMPMVIDPPSGFGSYPQFQTIEGYPASVGGSASNYWTETSWHGE